MKFSAILLSGLATFAAAQIPAPYTDAKSGITFNTFTHSSGAFFGLALPANTTATDFIATMGGKGTGWTGVSLGGGMVNKLLLLAWPNNQAILGSFRKTTSIMSPPVATGTFTQTPIANGTYVNSTHWTYTFLCKNCILTDGTTFKASDAAPKIGYAINANPPTTKGSASSAVSKHTAQGQVEFDLSKARNANFGTWATWAAPAVAFQA